MTFEDLHRHVNELMDNAAFPDSVLVPFYYHPPFSIRRVLGVGGVPPFQIKDDADDRMLVNRYWPREKDEYFTITRCHGLDLIEEADAAMEYVGPERS